MTRRAALPAALLPVLAAALACLACLVPGCTDLGSMPTEPTVAADGQWTLKYEPIALNHLRAVWAMDADDAWFAGYQGTLLHWDGRAVERHASPIDRDLHDLDGCATDEVWAVGHQAVLRWDGRRWASLPLEHNSTFYSVLCEAPDRIHVGGRVRRSGEWHGVVRHFTGRGWKDWEMPEPDSEVRKVWRPHADGPLFAIVRDTTQHAYRLDGGRWDLMDWPGEAVEADGDLVMLYRAGEQPPISLHRIEPDHTLSVVCEAFAGERVIRSRAILAGFDRGLQYLYGCERRTVLDALSDDILDLAVPERPGPSGPAVFAVGENSLAMVGGWRPDWSMEWRKILPIDSYQFGRPLLADENALFAPAYGDHTGGVFVLDHAGRRLEPLEYTPAGMFFLANGDLLTWSQWGEHGYGELDRRDAQGAWHALPATDRYLVGVWGSRVDDLVAMTRDGEFLQLVDGEWRVRDTLGGHCHWFAGVAADHLYASISVPELEFRRLLEFNGEIWRDITPDDVDQVWECYLGPHSGTLYARCFADWNSVPLKYRDGQWEDYPEGEEMGVDSEDMQEAADGGLYQRSGRRIFRLFPGGWKPTYEHEEYLWAFFVHPEAGLSVVVGENRLFHHPYRPR